MTENCSELNTDGLKQKAVKGAGINIVTNFINFFFHTIGVIFLARLLTPRDFGLVAMVTAFSMLPLNFGFNGFTEYIIQKKEISMKEINAIFWVHVYLALFLTICFVGFGFFLVYFYSEPVLSQIAAAMATSFILVALYTTPRALLRREMKFSSIAIADLSAKVLSIVFALAAAMSGMAYWAVAIRQLSVPIVVVVITWIFSPWRPSTPRDFSIAWTAIKYTVKIFCNFSIGYFARNMDKMLLAKFHGSTLLGTYDRAYYLSSLPAEQLLSPLASVALSTLSRLRDDKKRFVMYYLKAVGMVSFIGTIASIVLMLSANDLVPLLLGPGWAETGRILMAFCPGIAATLIYGTHSWLHLSLGTPGRWLKWNMISLLITATALIIAAPYGAVTMAASYSTVRYILVFPGLWYAGRSIELRITALLRYIWPYFTAGVLISSFWLLLPVYWSQLNLMIISFTPLQRLIITATIVPVLYAATVSILQRNFSSIREVISLIKLMLSRKAAQRAQS